MAKVVCKLCGLIGMGNRKTGICNDCEGDTKMTFQIKKTDHFYIASPLLGSEKQREWAHRIRDQRADELEVWLTGQETTLRGWKNSEHYNPETPVDVEAIINKISFECRRFLIEQNHARYWIETRRMEVYQMLNEFTANKCEPNLRPSIAR